MFAKLENLLFAVAHHEQVHKIRQRFGVEGAGAAADHKGRIHLVALLPRQRDVRQLQHIEDVGIAHLVLQRKAHDVEFAHRCEGFQRIERDIVFAH